MPPRQSLLFLLTGPVMIVIAALLAYPSETGAPDPTLIAQAY
ncbi:hypothetical protein [Jannaschia sp. M317]|nr:hypothetical protein [Jannaschia sp. M317]